MAKKNLNLTRSAFNANARPITISVAGNPVVATPKEFSTGSLGWFAAGKALVEINGEMVQAQVSCNVTLIGSKELPKDGE